MLSAEHVLRRLHTFCSALRIVDMSMAQKDPAAVRLGRKGGKAAAKNRTPKQRKEHARKVAQARWMKEKEK
jgi:hypothetical protein